MGNISYAGCLLTSVRYAGKNRFECDFRRKTCLRCLRDFRLKTLLTSRSNRFSLRILQMLANILHMKCCPFFALLKDFRIFKIGSDSKEIRPREADTGKTLRTYRTTQYVSGKLENFAVAILFMRSCFLQI